MGKIGKEQFVKELQLALDYPYSSNVGDLVEIAINFQMTGNVSKWHGNGKADVAGYSVKALLYSDYAISSNVTEEILGKSLDEIIRACAVDETVNGMIVVEDAEEFFHNRTFKTLTVDEYIEHVRNRVYFSNCSSKRKHNIMLKVGKKVRTEQEIMDSKAKAIRVKAS